MVSQSELETIIHAFLQEKGYDGYVPSEMVTELAERIVAAEKK